MFLDHIRIHAKAGDGGRGCVSFRRESFVPRGGPDGGDGGRGGHVIFRADTHVDSLTPFFYEPIVKARNGEHGMGRQCSGKSAQDKIVPVPVGTIIYRVPTAPKLEGLEASVAYGTDSTFVDLSQSPQDAEVPFEVRRGASIDPSELEIVADLTQVGQEFILCKGGKGGIGNVHFKSSRNRVPTQYTEGVEGEEGDFYLELRKIADAGLVGYPNAGKSTLLGKISAAHPKVAAYPFTTLTPHIGVVELNGADRVTVADIPGLIEGAHANVGLGHDFLRHIVRCKLLLFVLDMAGSEGREPIEDLQKLRKELDLHDPKLSERPWIIVANKMDMPEAAEKLEHFKGRYKKVEIIPISAEEGEGIEALKKRIGELVSELTPLQPEPVIEEPALPEEAGHPEEEAGPLE
ncbi:MAG: GTP-binding protein Obg/CgtA [Chthoniobacteraceae bacterium]|nr:GTP-binding protein Obg/CgtA [Chthoniobacteraceae bacterium]